MELVEKDGVGLDEPTNQCSFTVFTIDERFIELNAVISEKDFVGFDEPTHNKCCK